jgi:hypothetical protein
MSSKTQLSPELPWGIDKQDTMRKLSEPVFPRPRSLLRPFGPPSGQVSEIVMAYQLVLKRLIDLSTQRDLNSVPFVRQECPTKSDIARGMVDSPD